MRPAMHPQPPFGQNEDHKMNHHFRTFIAIALTVVGLALTASHVTAQDINNQKQAAQFIKELETFNKGKADIRRPIANMQALMRQEFSAYREAVNSSETMEEADQKYQVNLQDFKEARAQFDAAIATAEAIGANSKFPEIQALANQYVVSLKSAQSRVNNIAVAFKYHDAKALLSDCKGLASDVRAVGLHWRAQRPAISAKLETARAHFKRVNEPEVKDCPYEDGTKQHVLHCILGQPMSEGTGN